MSPLVYRVADGAGATLSAREEGGIPMKPSKRTEVPRAPARGEAGDVEGQDRDARVDSIEGEEGNGGAYGHPRSDKDGKGDRSRERG
jgi:hypothetical protein